MSNFNFKILDSIILTLEDILAKFASGDSFLETFTKAFGNTFNIAKAQELQTQWSSRNFTQLPKIEFRPSTEINYAYGAFSRDTNTIYLAQEYITQNIGNGEAIARVILEEIGHWVDSQINTADAPGDEGNIFARLVSGETISETQLVALKQENDIATVVIDGKSVQIEQAIAINSNPFYKYDIIAKTGDQGIQRIGFRTSINDLGKVAFTGDLNTSIFGSSAIFVGDNLSLNNITLNTFNAPDINWGTAVQINNQNQVIAAWSSNRGTSAVYLVNGNTVDDFKLIAGGGGSTSFFPSPPFYPFEYSSILIAASLNNNNQNVFLAFKKELESFFGIGPFGFPQLQYYYTIGDPILVSATPPRGSTFVDKTLNFPIIARPLIADNGNIIVTESTNSGRSLSLYNQNLGLITTIASASGSDLGIQPGISDDGKIVVFAQNKGNGVGIFASVDTGAGRELILIAGENSISQKPELGYWGTSITTHITTQLKGNPIFFSSFDIDSRVGVSHVERGRPGILDDNFVVTFIGTPNKASRNNPITGNPLLFSDKKGLWTVKVTVDSPLAGGTGFKFNKTSAIPVVQVGDIINGATVNDITVYDPIANVGAINPNPNSHQITFVANTTSGEMVIKASHLDSDGDGLLDEWEDNGIDIDKDGVIDLNLKAMGADKNQKDLFLEIDWLAPDSSTRRVFSPQSAALKFIEDVFNNKGIKVHIDAGTGLSRNMGSGSLEGGQLIGRTEGVHYDLVYFDADFPSGPPPGLDFNRDGAANYRSFENIKDNYFSTASKRARELAFRYVVFADRSEPTGSSGRGELQQIDPDNGDYRSIAGNDLIVSLQGIRNITNFIGPFPGGIPIPAGFLQGQTLLHELGHTLGLRHGGADNIRTNPPIPAFIASGDHDPAIAALKSGYKSVMNYLYQLYPDTATNTLIRDYSSGNPFDDWSNIKLDFANYFTTLGNSYGIESQAGAAGSTHTEELTVDDIKKIFSPSALDDQVPIINLISAPTQIQVGSPLNVEVNATDNIGIDSVAVSFDVNGDGTVDNSSETIIATKIGTDKYQATFTNISGSVGSRTVTAIATDLANFTVETTADVIITVNSVNTPPQAVNDTVVTNEDTSISINVLTNDSDADGNPLNISLVTNPSNGAVVINNNGFTTYTPNLNFNGTDTFTYTVSDGTDTSTATVTVTVNPVNDPPVATNDTATTSFGTPVTIAVLSNDSDIETNPISLSSFNPTSSQGGSITRDNNGTLSNLSDDKLIYTPATGFSGTDSFTYTISDGVNTANATVTITVTPPVNQPPQLKDDKFIVNEDSSNNLLAVFADNGNGVDSDPNGDTLIITAVGTPNQGGTLSINPTKDRLLYTPKANFNGTETFTYTVSDGKGGTSTATVTVTVNPVNDVPIATSDAATTNEDTPININVLVNDTDIDGDPLTLSLIGNPSNGTAIINNNGTPNNPSDDFIAYTPKANFNGTDTFSYTVSDGKGGNKTATVSVTVNPVNDAPTLEKLIPDQTTSAGKLFNFTFAGDTFKDIDTGDTLTYTASSSNGSPLPSWLTFNPVTRTFSGTPDILNQGNYDIKVTATDQTGATASDIFNLTVSSATINTIKGTAGRDTLTGTNGDDFIVGYQSRDTITTGKGSDRIVYTSLVDAGDIITDFEVGQDKIDLSAVLKSVGYNSSRPFTDGYVGIKAQGADSLVLLDADGVLGTATSKTFILVQGVSANQLNNASNFIF